MITDCKPILRYARVGDFHEFLGTDAITAARLTGLPLSRRDGRAMLGFPVVQAATHMAALCAAGYALHELPSLAALRHILSPQTAPALDPDLITGAL